MLRCSSMSPVFSPRAAVMPSPVRAAVVLGRAVCRAACPPFSSPSYHTHLSIPLNNTLGTVNHPSSSVHVLNHSSLYLPPHRCASTTSLSPPPPPLSTLVSNHVDKLTGATSAAAAKQSQSAAHSADSSQSASSPPFQPSFWVPFLTLLSLFPILFAVDDAVVTLATVHGRSMQPTLNPHLHPAAATPSSSSSSSSSVSSSRDVVLIWKLSSQSPASLPHGSLLVLQSPYNPTRSIIKRLIGRQGDWIATQHTASDGDERAVGGEYGQIELIGKGRVWVEGENEAASVEDSREYGQMPAALVQGRVLAVVWPPARMRWVDNTLQHVGGEKRLRNRILAW